MGLGLFLKGDLNHSINLISKAKDECVELGQMILPIQEKIGENWQGEAATAMQSVLTNIFNEVKTSSSVLSGAESSIRSQAYYITNNYTGDEE